MPASANWLATIPHGIAPQVCPFDPKGAGDYLAFLGRISPEKRPDRAIEIAKRAGVSLKIAAKVDHVDLEYFNAEVARLTQKLGDAVSDALAAGRRRGGPRPFGELLQAVAWLREAAACFVYPYAQGEDRL